MVVLWNQQLYIYVKRFFSYKGGLLFEGGILYFNVFMYQFFLNLCIHCISFINWYNVRWLFYRKHNCFVYLFKTNTFRAYNAPPSGALVQLSFGRTEFNVWHCSNTKIENIWIPKECPKTAKLKMLQARFDWRYCLVETTIHTPSISVSRIQHINAMWIPT
jgi:hypothetical protein